MVSLDKNIANATAYLCFTHRTCVLEPRSIDVFDIALNGEQDELRHCALRILRDFLLLTETDITEATETKLTKKQKQKVDQTVLEGHSQSFQISGVTASLMQRYLHLIRGFAIDPKKSYSIIAVQLIDLMLDQGAVNPRMVYDQAREEY